MTMITPSYLGETIEYSSLHACRSTLEDPTGSVALSVAAASPPRHPDQPRGCDKTFAVLVGSPREHAHRAPSGPSTREVMSVYFARQVRRREFAPRPPPRRPSHRPRAGCEKAVLAPPIEGASASSPAPSWPLALPSRRLARAFAGPSPAPSPDPRTVPLLHLGCLRRGSNLPSRVVGSS